MAFIESALFCISGTTGNSPRIFSYGTEDSIAAILAEGYFNEAYRIVRVNDSIICVSGTNFISVRIESIVNRVVAVNAASEDRGTKRKYVRKASDFDSPVDSTIEYFIDGIVDMTNASIEVPSSGINLAGYDFDVSRLTSSEDNYTMFTSPAGGSGNFLFKDISFEVTGANSKVYDMVDSDGSHAFECARINYNNCASLGEINGYRQGLETGTGRFGGTPHLTLSGTWSGGYSITTSIVRGLTDGAYSLFQEGASFTMASRFKSDQNVDLPASASYLNFSSSNFPNPSTLQLVDMLITRNGVTDASDTNITPNTTHDELSSAWANNNGIPNTHEGGMLTITSEATTTINTQGVYELLAGVWAPTLLEHFDEPSNGQLRHLGNNPREYEVLTELIIDGTANNEVEIRLMKHDASASSNTEVHTQVRQINALVGGRDVAFFNDFSVVELDQNDYIYYEIRNNSGAGNLTAEIDSFFIVKAR